uniref:Small auxin up regulated protein n=1 Tax=Boehmeria nivea TaxID=83906 RepID=A0A172J200_BOENI|nr:small auxin up regulated protein [Boehmeria nivea]
MISALKKLLISFLRKWRKVAANEGRFVIYTTDEKRFALPLAYLCKTIFLELLRMSEEEFGLSTKGPIRLPCDSALMNYIVLLVQRGVARDLEKALLNTIDSATSCYSSSKSFYHGLCEQYVYSSVASQDQFLVAVNLCSL